MSTNKIKELVLDAINSRKDKTNKITQLAMAINGTYVEDTTYVDDRIYWAFQKSDNEFSIQYSNISKIVEKINSLKSGDAGLFLTEEQASRFSILAGLTGVQIMDLSQKDMYDMYGPHFTAMGVDITGIVLVVAFTIGELDNNTKFTYNGVEYTLLPTDEEPVATAPIFDSIDSVGESGTYSPFQLGDNIIYNQSQDNFLMSPTYIFVTQEQYSKMNFSAEIPQSVDYTQEDVLAETLISDNDTLSEIMAHIQETSLSQIPENIVCVINIPIIVDMIGTNAILSFTITYDGVDYVYDSTNVQVTIPEEEPEVDTLYSVDCQSINSGTLVTSSFNLGDNITIVNDGSDVSLSPYALLLTSEQAQNFSISVTGKTGVSQEAVDEAAAAFQLVAYSSSGLEDNATISQFATEHNITHICMISALGDYLNGIDTEYGVISSATITYNGHTYVYDYSKVAVTNTETEQQGE